MNLFDRALMSVAPGWAAARSRARLNALAYYQAYEAAQKNRLRKQSRDYGSANNAVATSAVAVRNEARALDRNHDIVTGALNALVQNFIGPTGIGVEPQPRNANGDIDEDLAAQIRTLRREWMKRPEVTRQLDWASSERLLARSWCRDGEALFQELPGYLPYLTHSTAVPYSIELLEADLLPLDYDDPANRILQGVERNAWGQPVAYHLYREHPGDPYSSMLPQTKRVLADRIRHVRMIDRIGQVRGISLLASVITRLHDLKDYEESERIAAKIAASMAAVIIKGDPQLYVPPNDTQSTAERMMRFQPGMVFDNLRPGESVQSIDTKRPNTNLEPHRNGQLRAVASGMRVSFSTLAKNYNGTYSSQRQELVEQYGAYGVLAFEFISQCSRPVHERLVYTAAAAGNLKLPRNYDMAGLVDALYVPPSMPWINPYHEAQAYALLEENTYMSGPEIIRRRGADPHDVLDQQSAWLQRKREWGIAAKATTAAPADELSDPPDTDPNEQPPIKEAA